MTIVTHPTPERQATLKWCSIVKPAKAVIPISLKPSSTKPPPPSHLRPVHRLASSHQRQICSRPSSPVRVRVDLYHPRLVRQLGWKHGAALLAVNRWGFVFPPYSACDAWSLLGRDSKGLGRDANRIPRQSPAPSSGAHHHKDHGVQSSG
jgi:hypothetical protein